MEQNQDFTRIREWASERGIYSKGDVKTQYVKLMEEAGELGRAILKDDEREFKDAIGDMVVVLTNLAHLGNTTIEHCITSAWNEIKDRQGAMVNGTFMKGASEDEDKYYKCIGLKESACKSWSKYFTIGKIYKEIINENVPERVICLISDHGFSFLVDSDQFEFLPF